MNRAVFILILICIAWGLYTFFHSSSKEGELQEIKPAEAQSGWRHFLPSTGKFSVDLPVMPQQASEMINDAMTQQLRRYEMYVSEGADGTVYLINLITYPSDADMKDPQKLFKSFIDDLLASNPRNQLISSTSAAHQGLDGMEFKMKTQDAIMNSKMFLEGSTLYVLSKVSKTETDNGDFDKFVSSFRINGRTEPNPKAAK